MLKTKFKTLGDLIAYEDNTEKREDVADKVLSDLGLIGNDVTKKAGETSEDVVARLTFDRTLLGEVDNLMKDVHGRYSLAHKNLALIYLNAIRDEEREDLRPDFYKTSSILGIGVETLRKWWMDKERITAMAPEVIQQSMSFVSLKLLTSVMKMVDTLDRIDFTGMTPKDFTQLFNVAINKLRLVSGLSTENIAHKHKHTLQHVLPETPDDDGKKRDASRVTLQ